MLATAKHCRFAAALLIALSFAGNFAFLRWDCPLELAPDEAHYWQWSRRLDWCYYSKGPLIAWLMRASCELFGEWSVRLVGTEMLAVRLPALVSHTALLAGLFVLSESVLRSGRVAVALLAVAIIFPPLTAAAVISTIDPPFLACWCWALVAVQRALNGGRFHWWVLAGAFAMIGVLAKYTMLLFPLLVGTYLIVNRRSELRRCGFWCLPAFALLGCVPMIAWNVRHDWVSVQHVFAQTGVMPPRKPIEPWRGFALFIGGQFGVLLGFGFAAFATAAWRYRRSDDPALSLVWWCSVPAWWVFASAGMRTGGQVNWPAAAYIGGAVLACAWVREQLASGSRVRRMAIGCSLAATITSSLAGTLLLHAPHLSRPMLLAILNAPDAADQPRIRKLDPTCRLSGWQTLAREVDRVRDRLERETGREPVIAGMVWTTPGELAFYCRRHPETYSLGLVLGDRHSQYDCWRPNPIFDAQAFRGRTFIYVGDEIPDAARAFVRIEPPIRVLHRERGIATAAWTIWVCHGYRGFVRNPAERTAY